MLKLSNYQMMSLIQHPVSIDKTPPFWFKGPHFPQLAPSINLVSLWKKGIITLDEYKFRYHYDYLRKMDPWEVLKQISNLTNSSIDNCTLVNYDSNNVISFRHFVGEWIHNATGMEVKELTPADAKAMSESKVCWINPITVMSNIYFNYANSVINEIPTISEIKERICIPTEEIKTTRLSNIKSKTLTRC